MARTRARTAPEPVVEDNGDRDWSNLKDKDTTWMHEAFADFIKDESGITITAKQVQAVTAMRVAFRQSDTYLDAKEEAKADQEPEPEPEPAAKPKRSRAAKAKAEPEAAKPATRTRRSRTKNAPEVTVGKDDETPKRTRRTRRAAKPATDEASTTPEAPF